MTTGSSGKNGLFISTRTLGWLLAFIGVIATATTAYAFLRSDVSYIMADRAKNPGRYASAESLKTIDTRLIEIARRLDCIDRKLDAPK